jgi:hypothetical protein
MQHLINERKALLALVLISLGALLLIQIKLFAVSVLVSEKGLALLLLALVLFIGGAVTAAKAIRKV